MKCAIPIQYEFCPGDNILRFAKPLALTASILLAAGCSTFSGEQSAATGGSDAYSNPQSIELQTRVARLQTENARLANRVLELQREIEALEKTRTASNSSVPENQTEETDSAPAETVVALRESSPAPAQPVVDNPEAPEMAQSDVPVESAPRLTQPTFAATDAVFENEAASPAAPPSTLYGVHLASYRQTQEAREGWQKLQRENPDELGLLEPRLEAVEVPDKGEFFRLIGGGFSSQEKAEALCSNLKSKGLYCSVSEFSGERLSLTENTG